MKAASCNHYAKSRLNYGLPPRRRNKQTNVHNSIIALPNGGSHIIGLFDIEKSAQPQFFGPMWVITHSPSTFRSSGVLTKIATTTLMCIKPMLLLKSTSYHYYLLRKGGTHRMGNERRGIAFDKVCKMSNRALLLQYSREVLHTFDHAKLVIAVVPTI